MIHINRPSGYYIGQVRRYGAQRWRTVTGRRKTPESAMSAAVLQMGREDLRVRALFIDRSGWYEPTVVFEGSR